MNLPQWKIDFFEAMDNHGRGENWVYRKAPQMPDNWSRIEMAQCHTCKVEGESMVRVNYGTLEKPELGPEVYCLACGQKRANAMNELVAKH